MQSCLTKTYLCFVLSLGSLLPPPLMADMGRPQRVLFIGNSYTEHMRPCLTSMLDNSPWRSTHLEFITHSGMRLEQHWANPTTLEKIHTGDWDRVILQEYSRLPALIGQPAESFQISVARFTQEIRNAGAKPMLYMTWGRRDGDAENRKALPDFRTMQTQLSLSYEQAAEKNQAALVPVGLVWSKIREEDAEFGRALYDADGSHPSAKGSCLAAAVFLRNLFADDLAKERRPAVFNPREWDMIRLAVTDIEHILSP